jgi:hypothetical protein
MEKSNRMEMNLILRNYKLPNGGVNYNQVLRIPSKDRMQALVVSEGYEKIHILLSAGIQVAMESLNLTNPLTPNQIVDLSDALIDTSSEDNLGIEDIVIFLQRLVRGEAGKLFNSMDIPKFMELFENYRQERHAEYLRVKEELNVQHKAMGSYRGVRQDVDDKNVDPKTFFELLDVVNQEKYGAGDS